jgi:hypothetical protein
MHICSHELTTRTRRCSRRFSVYYCVDTESMQIRLSSSTTLIQTTPLRETRGAKFHLVKTVTLHARFENIHILIQFVRLFLRILPFDPDVLAIEKCLESWIRGPNASQLLDYLRGLEQRQGSMFSANVFPYILRAEPFVQLMLRLFGSN